MRNQEDSDYHLHKHSVERRQFSDGGRGIDKLADLQPGASFLLGCSLQLWA